MPEFKVDFYDRRPDWSIWVHNVERRKKQLKLHDLVKCSDVNGSHCHGFIERIDERTNLMLVALDRETFVSARYA